MRTWVRRIFLGIGVLLVVALIGKLIQLGTMSGRTTAAATTAMTSSAQTGAEELAALTVLLERDLGMPVTRSARGYTCQIGHRDQGWIVHHYYQECSWQGIDYFQVEDLDGLTEKYRLSATTSTPETCDLLFLPLREEEKRFRFVSAHTHPAGATGRSCEIPTMVQGTAESFVPSETVVTQAVPSLDLDPDADWVVVSHEVSFFSKDLGCGIGIIFCTSPMSDPAMPDPSVLPGTSATPYQVTRAVPRVSR